MRVGYKIMTGALSGLDKARSVLEELRGMGYNEAMINETKAGLYTVVVMTGTDKDKVDKARIDVERVTDRRVAVQSWDII